MIDLQQLDIERACTRLILLYAQAIDAADFELAAGCYLDDGRRIVNGREVQGRDQIVEALRETGAGRLSCHVYSNIVIEVDSPERAMATAYVTLWRARGERVRGVPLQRQSPTAVSRQRDELVLTPNGWKFALRETESVFTSRPPGETPARAGRGPRRQEGRQEGRQGPRRPPPQRSN